MDIKRVAFETKPVNQQSAVSSHQSAATVPDAGTRPSRTVNREDIASLVDRFLKQKLAETPEPLSFEPAKSEAPIDTKTILHEITPDNAVQKPVPIKTVDFVSEDDVRQAINNGEKIYISKKTILTPSARDLGEEKEIFATI